MTLVICPGIHPPVLTTQFLTVFPTLKREPLIYPTDRYPAYSAPHLLQFLREQPQGSLSQPLVFLGFSAGVVGAIGTALLWLAQGGSVRALIALDGWGMPLAGPFPIHRVSHDAWTHWSSIGFGGWASSFYADPAVSHLNLWRSPHLARGWVRSPIEVTAQPTAKPATAAAFLQTLLVDYGEADDGAASYGGAGHGGVGPGEVG